MPPRVAERDEPEVSLVVPTFNESQTIGRLLGETCAALDRCGAAYEVIVVDDDSSDETWRVAAACVMPRVRVVRRQGERGLASAVIRGWQAARGQILGTMNADFQHPPELLVPMVAAIKDADLVTATRFQRGAGFGDLELSRRLVAWGSRAAGRLLLPAVFAANSDPLSGFYLFRREGIAGVELSPVGFKTQIEILARGRFPRVKAVPYQMRRRTEGASKVNTDRAMDYLRHLARLRRAGE